MLIPHRSPCDEPPANRAASSSECSSPPRAITRRLTSTTALTISPNVSAASSASRSALIGVLMMRTSSGSATVRLYTARQAPSGNRKPLGTGASEQCLESFDCAAHPDDLDSVIIVEARHVSLGNDPPFEAHRVSFPRTQKRMAGSAHFAGKAHFAKYRSLLVHRAVPETRYY